MLNTLHQLFKKVKITILAQPVLALCAIQVGDVCISCRGVASLKFKVRTCQTG